MQEKESAVRSLSVKIEVMVEAKKAKALYRSLLPESKDFFRNGKAELNATPFGFLIRAERKDVAKMRALVNSYLRLLRAAISTLSEVS